MAFYDAKKIESEILNYWEKEKIPQRIVKFKKGKKFYLLDGPPYVNHIPHVGHVKTTTFKDVWGKFKAMQGFSVWWQPGFDCSGLPIENAVEKKLGITTKKDIERIGISRFIAECKKLAETNRPLWMALYKKLGAWRGWLEPYMTYKNYYIESGWWTIKRIYEKGLFVEGEKPGYWCPKCQTVLAGYEVSDSYQNLKDPSIYIKFKLKERDMHLLVWTTTPWTLPANVAIAVRPDEKYAVVDVRGEKLIVAKKRVSVFEELGLDYNIIDEFYGKELEGLKYEPVLDVPLQRELTKEDSAHQVIASIPIIKKRVASKVAMKGAAEEEEFGHLVDMETGTGLVHIAPGHGDVDNRAGKHYGLPEPSPVDEEGKLTSEAGKFAGIFVKDADKEIIAELERTGKLFYAGFIIHSYPLCWRCKTPLIYRKSHQWFLKIDTLKDIMMKEAENVRWLPEFARERFLNTLADAPDWAITRQRYWGIPLPIWKCQKCQRRMAIGSVAELKKMSVKPLTDDVDLHKDSVDKIKLKCDCGGVMSRYPYIMDVWFDSGIAPWASLGYPFKNKQLFKALWPVDLIDESQDQIRGWFYTLFFCAFATFGESPYKTVCLNGWTLDEKGEKMSKSLGNVVWAEDAWARLGADMLRLYYCYDVPPWNTQKFNLKSAEELKRFFNILLNCCDFIKLYAKRQEAKVSALEDKWIISRINTIIADTTSALEDFRFHHAARGLVEFVIEDLSRCYIKLIRSRLAQKDSSAAYCLYYVMERLLKLLSPFVPFVAEKIWLELFKEKGMSVHMQGWPVADKKAIDTGLEKDIAVVRQFVEAVNAARQVEGIKLRWTLKDVWIEPKDKKIEDVVIRGAEIAKILSNFQTLRIYKKSGIPEERPEKWHDSELGRIAIGRPDMDEAFFRELVRCIQEMRKSAGLNFSQKIALYLDPEIKGYLKQREEELKKAVNAKEIRFKKAEKAGLEWEGKRFGIGFEMV
ncbi:MAG: isoleucine--tRNA ligase [Candidatus Aenigmatarchaeota archaeon]